MPLVQFHTFRVIKSALPMTFMYTNLPALVEMEKGQHKKRVCMKTPTRNTSVSDRKHFAMLA